VMSCPALAVDANHALRWASAFARALCIEPRVGALFSCTGRTLTMQLEPGGRHAVEAGVRWTLRDELVIVQSTLEYTHKSDNQDCRRQSTPMRVVFGPRMSRFQPSYLRVRLAGRATDPMHPFRPPIFRMRSPVHSTRQRIG
jgi:hypothetical protein